MLTWLSTKALGQVLKAVRAEAERISDDLQDLGRRSPNEELALQTVPAIAWTRPRSVRSRRRRR